MTPEKPREPEAGETSGGGDSGSDFSGVFRRRPVTTCSFCEKSSREMGPMVEGPNGIQICPYCTEICYHIFVHELAVVLGQQPDHIRAEVGQLGKMARMFRELSGNDG